jgi:hypothetical protein
MLLYNGYNNIQTVATSEKRGAQRNISIVCKELFEFFTNKEDISPVQPNSKNLLWDIIIIYGDSIGQIHAIKIWMDDTGELNHKHNIICHTKVR